MLWSNLYNLFVVGPDLPIPLCYHIMAPSPTGRGVILVGGISDIAMPFHYQHKMFELVCTSLSGIYFEELEFSLKFPRTSHLAFTLSRSVVENFLTRSGSLVTRWEN